MLGNTCSAVLLVATTGATAVLAAWCRNCLMSQLLPPQPRCCSPLGEVQPPGGVRTLAGCSRMEGLLTADSATAALRPPCRRQPPPPLSLFLHSPWPCPCPCRSSPQAHYLVWITLMSPLEYIPCTHTVPLNSYTHTVANQEALLRLHCQQSGKNNLSGSRLADNSDRALV